MEKVWSGQRVIVEEVDGDWKRRPEGSTGGGWVSLNVRWDNAIRERSKLSKKH